MRSVDEVYELSPPTWPRRNLPLEKVLDIAGGRVWSGTDALALGLVDTNGGLKTAIAIAADKAELGDKFRIVEMTELRPASGRSSPDSWPKSRPTSWPENWDPGPASGARFVRRWDSRA